MKRIIQVETLTLLDGSKVEAIRDVEAVRKLAALLVELTEMADSLSEFASKAGYAYRRYSDWKETNL